MNRSSWTYCCSLAYRIVDFGPNPLTLAEPCGLDYFDFPYHPDLPCSEISEIGWLSCSENLLRSLGRALDSNARLDGRLRFLLSCLHRRPGRGSCCW